MTDLDNATELLFWILEQSKEDKGEMAYLAEMAIEEATVDLARALSA